MLEDSKQLTRDISTVGRFGNGDYELKISDTKYLEYIMSLVVLTRERSYVRRPEKLQPLIDAAYRKYPRFCDTMRRRADTYNASRERLFQLEREGRALLFAPHSTEGFHRTEKDVEKIRALWKDGYDEGMERLDEVQAFLSGS